MFFTETWLDRKTVSAALIPSKFTLASELYKNYCDVCLIEATRWRDLTVTYHNLTTCELNKLKPEPKMKQIFPLVKMC